MSGNATTVSTGNISTGPEALATGRTSTTRIFVVIFQCAVVTVAIVGLLANAFVLWVTVSQMRKRLVENVLILNQLSLDLLSCILLAVTYLTKLSKISLVGWTGYWLCLLLTGETFMWAAIDGSIFNLAAIAIERYIKICHSLWHKAHFRSWIAYLAVAFIWVCGYINTFSVAVTTTRLINGRCMPAFSWPSESVKTAYGIWYFLSFYVFLIVIFILCYGRVFAVLKHQQKILSGENVVGSLGDDSQQKQAQMKLMRTAFMLALCFAVCWLPNQVCYCFMNFDPNVSNDVVVYVWYVSLFFGFVSICANPFIYGAKSTLVKDYIRGIMCRCRTSLTVFDNQSELPERRFPQSSGNLSSSNMTKKTSMNRFQK